MSKTTMIDGSDADRNEPRDPWAGSFMQPDVREGDYFEVSTSYGMEVVPTDVCGRTMTTIADALRLYLDGKPTDEDDECEVKHGWLARMSAPGYMDCTPWTAFETEAGAHAALQEMYGNN